MMKQTNNYLDKKEFSHSVLDHTNLCKEHAKKGLSPPRISNELGSSILLLCERLANKSNFALYTYKDNMIADAVDNCLRVLVDGKFTQSAKTKSGEMNAFGYFTTIAFRAMVRRIKKENLDNERKLTFMKRLQEIDLVTYDPHDEPRGDLMTYFNGLMGDIDDSRINQQVNREFEREALREKNEKERIMK